jgi:hypothetical protein
MKLRRKPKKSTRSPQASTDLLKDIRALIDAAQNRVAHAVNAELVLLYWHIGTRIRHDVLRQARAEYGEKIASTLSRQLTASYGLGFSRQNLFHMLRFAEAWPDHSQGATLATHVGWNHFKEILYLENEMQRQFYANLLNSRMLSKTPVVMRFVKSLW